MEIGPLIEILEVELLPEEGTGPGEAAEPGEPELEESKEEAGREQTGPPQRALHDRSPRRAAGKSASATDPSPRHRS